MKNKNRCEFPEKLFESLVNHELINLFSKRHTKVNLWSPSQTKEASLGYDSLFEAGARKLVAIQYKVPSYRYVSKYKGCFKFELHKNSNKECKQHELLCELLDKHIVDNVFYIAPEFLENRKLNNYSRSGTLLKHIAQITPTKLISYKGNHHCVYGDLKPNFFCNVPSESSYSTIEEIFFKDVEIDQIPLSERRKQLKKIIDSNQSEMTGVMFYSVF